MSEKTQKQMLEDACKAVSAIQETVDAVEAKKLDKDAVDVEKINKAAKDACDALEGLQKTASKEAFDELQADLESKAKEAAEKAEALEGELKKADERFADLEQEVAKIKGAGGGEDDDVDVEAKAAVYGYLRKGTEIDDEVLERMANRHARKTLAAANESQIERQVKDLVAGSGPDGGYFLQADRSNAMIQRIFETSPLRGLANVVTTTSDVWEIVLDDDEGDVDWVGEVDARNDTATPQISLVKIPVHELAAQPKATQKMLDDAGFDIEAWLAGKTARRIGRAENLAFVSGDGSQRPKGFLSYPNWTSAGVYQRNAVERVQATGGGGGGNFGADDLIGLKHTLFEDYQPGATWGMSRQTFTSVMQLKDSEGQYLLRPDILMAGAEKMLLGSGVVFLNDMPDSGTASGLGIVIADWSEFYAIVDRLDIRVLRDPYTAKPYVRFYTTKRVGGAVTNFEAGKILTFTA